MWKRACSQILEKCKKTNIGRWFDTCFRKENSAADYPFERYWLPFSLQWLTVEGQKCHQAPLCWIIRPVRRRIAEETKKIALSTWQCTRSNTHNIPPPSPQLKWLNYATRCCLIHLFHPTPVWAPCNLLLFSNMKKSFTRLKLNSNEEAYFTNLQKRYFSGELKKLQRLWVKCPVLRNKFRHFSKV